MSGKPHKITVLLEPEEFNKFDAYCESLGFKKSTLIARLIRDHLLAAGFEIQQPHTLDEQRIIGKD
jgi:hypothetical protein